ncbi:hypothetical protein IVB12_09565 [Bradyrhizobium sp. 179]|nr:hypothetical protein [Bradyrhizobium sp. 179]
MSYGHRYTLVMASLTKRCLQGKLPAEMRLEFLQHLEKMTDTWLTPEVIAIVEPMEAKGIELSEEARKLGWKGDRTHSTSLHRNSMCSLRSIPVCSGRMTLRSQSMRDRSNG